MNRKPFIAVSALVCVVMSIVLLGWFVLAKAISGPANAPDWSAASQVVTARRTDRKLSDDERSKLLSAIALMQSRGLADDAALAGQILTDGVWRAAGTGDLYLKGAEDEGDTPFAYTLSAGRHPEAIVLAPRFFDATQTGRAAIMIHEMGHYRAYIATGTSTEYDGYKREYDKSKQLGLGVRDSLVYFGMLDGVAQYVVPRDPSYAQKADVKNYINQSSNE